MISGRVTYFTSNESVVTFSVQEEQSMATCKIKARMSFDEQKLIDIDTAIWWDSDNVYLTIGDVPDCKFQKIGFSYGIR